MFERPRWLKAAPNSPWAFLGVNVWTLKKPVDEFIGSLTINIRKVQYSVILWLKIVYPKKHHQTRSSKFEIRKIPWSLVMINFSRGTYPLGNQHIPVIHTKHHLFNHPAVFILPMFETLQLKRIQMPISACISYETHQRKTKQTKNDKTNHHTLVYLEKYVYVYQKNQEASLWST